VIEQVNGAYLHVHGLLDTADDDFQGGIEVFGLIDLLDDAAQDF
jgi:hypothetical protein